MKAIGYIRVSTAEQERSGLGLEAQRAAITEAVKARGWTLDGIYSDTESGGVKKRPRLLDALEDLTGLGSKGCLVVARLDRLTRSLAHLSEMIDMAENQGWSLVALDLGLDTSTDTGRLVARIMGSVAQWERERIRARVKESVRIKMATGWCPGGAMVGPEVTAAIVAARGTGATMQAIATGLNERGVPTVRGGTWRPGTVAKVLKRAHESR